MKRRIRLLLIFAIIFHSGPLCKPVYSKNPTIVKNAIKEINHGEEAGNNQGKHIRLYLQGKENLAWCAGFVSYILKESGFNLLEYNLSAKSIYNQAIPLGLITHKPEAGDLIVFWRTSPTSWKGHIGIIEKIEGDTITTIEGNVGKYPAKVRRFTYDKNNIPRLLGYIKTEGGE